MTEQTIEQFKAEVPVEEAGRGHFHALKPGEKRYHGMIPSYYRDEYGRALLPVLIDMEEKGLDKEFLRVKNEKITTLYQRIQQSFLYCVDFLDAGGLLEKLRARVRIRKTPRGVVVCFKENYDKYTQAVKVANGTARISAFQTADIISVDWRRALDEFMNSDDEKELLLTSGFFLGPDDIDMVKMCVTLVPDQFQIVELNNYKLHVKRL